MSGRPTGFFAFVIFFLAASCSGLGQGPQSLITLHETAVSNEKATDFVLPVVTDAHGNIYARYSDGEHRADAISKIDPSGKKLASFTLASVSGLGGTEIGSFCVADDRLAVLARRGTSAHIVTFGLNGKLLSDAEVDADIQDGQIAPLGVGRLLVVGRARRQSGSRDSIAKVIVINTLGQQLGAISLDGDVAPIAKEKRITPRGDIRRDKDFEMSLVASVIATADDGNAYLMRYGRSGLVFVISPDGTVVHRFTLETPSDSLLAEIKVANHRIAALFMRKVSDADSEIAAVVVRTYDADSGKLLSSYLLDPRIPHLMAAYDGNAGFTFIGPEVVDLPDTRADEAGRLRIFQAGPR